jgi:hypothetical protein
VNVPQFEARVMAEALRIAGNPPFQDPSGLGVGPGALAAELDLASSIDNSSGDQAALRALGVASVTFQSGFRAPLSPSGEKRRK